MTRSDLDSSPRNPIIYAPASLEAFILHMCEIAAPGTLLIICADQQSFLQHLIKSTADKTDNVEGEGVAEAQHKPAISHPLVERTLRLLSVTRNIKAAFCPSVAAFHAYVSTIALRPKKEQARSMEPPSLAILNLVRMHQTTAYYSAQGLGKAFATAVEAAWQTRSRLILFEYPEAVADNVMMTIDGDPSDRMNSSGDELGEHEENRMADARHIPSLPPENIWQEQVPVLNTTTKTFGNLGDRGWMGRTVKIIDIASRWCTVQSLPTLC
jgi:hypothetical protein